jgi:hypothetical protein
MADREVRCDGCGRWGYWLTNREDDLPKGHKHDLPLSGGDAPGLRSDRPYCDACQEEAGRGIYGGRSRARHTLLGRTNDRAARRAGRR